MASCKTKVLLFGRTGSGKSTIANMLIKGNLDNPLLFETSSGIRGKTISFQREENDEYMVVDTVGFGEVEHGTVSHVEARNRLYDFFTKINQTGYNYFVFVRKWAKIDDLDDHLWSFFKKTFEGAEQNFVLLFTHCKHSTLEENLEGVKASFEGCSKYIAVDFPPYLNKHESYNFARGRRDEMMRARSLERLRNELDKYKCPLVTPSLRSTIRKGRLLLIGTCANATDMIAKLLVNGTFDHNPTSGKKEGHQGEASCSSSMCESTKDITPCLDVPTIEATLYEELEGRGWQVVSVLLDFGFIGSKFKHHRMYGFTYAIESAMLHGSYSHIIYIEECGKTATEVKIMHERITNMLMAVEDHLVAIIVQTKGGDHKKNWSDTQSQREKDVTERFKRWKTLHLQFPNVSNHPNVEVENIIVRNKSLCILEETLGKIVVPYILFQVPTIPNSIRESEEYKLFYYLYEEQEKRGMYIVKKVSSPFDALFNFYARRFGKSHGKIFSGYDVQPLHLASDYPISYEVFHILPNYHFKGSFLELKLEIPSPQQISVDVNCKLGYSIDPNWIWGELQVVDMHHVNKNTPKLAFTCNQWKGEYSQDGEEFRFSINATRSSEDVKNHIFLDNIEKGDTLILRLCPCFQEKGIRFLSACMRVEPTQEIINSQLLIKINGKWK